MQIQVNYEEVKQQGQYLNNQANQYDELIQSIYSRMHEIQSVWQGKDAQMFIEKAEAFHPQLQKMAQVIESYAMTLMKSADLYETIEQDRMAMASQLA